LAELLAREKAILVAVKLEKRKSDPHTPAPSEKAAEILRGEIPQPDRPDISFQKIPAPESWAGVIKSELDQEEISGVTFRRGIVRKAKELARLGVPWAIEFLADREDGRPRQQVGLEGKGGGPVEVKVVRYDDETTPEGGGSANG
jgi:hypothetical protein